MSYRLLALWLVCYAAAWTLLTVYLDPTLPYDAVEALNWGLNGEWGSPKNPWLVGAAMQPAIGFSWLPLNLYWYGGHFIAIAIGMLGVWLLARRLSGSTSLAWVALLTLNLSGIINFDIIPYNDNYLLVMLWPWMALFFHLAISRSANWWPAFALTAGLAMMAKYSTFAFVYFAALSTLFVPQIRRCYRQPQFYLAVAIWLALVLPNVFWLWNHDFAAFKWVDSQIKMQLNLDMLQSLLLVFYPSLVLWGILRRSGAVLAWPSALPMRVLLWVYLLPLGIIIFWFSFNVGGRLTEWLQPFFMLAPALLAGCVRQPPVRSLRAATIGLMCAALAVYLGYAAVMLGNVRNAGQKMVGIKAFSAEVERQWQERYGVELRYVGGEYLSQWMTVYAGSRPQTITRWSNHTRPNIYNVNISYPQIAQHGVALFGRLGEDCAHSDFGGELAHWPKMRLDWQQTLTFRADPQSDEQTLCVGFVRPQ
ncbi:glycosyltransferase family 39 protein [Serratia marcescens]|uniref:glycosyltransferase family 39 protein n=1 Tax=Serratia marcescens TaxID=615 RepID=UPI003EE2B685